MYVGGKVHFVLHRLEALLGDEGARVIVDAEGINLQNLAIEHFIRTAYVAHAGQ